MRGEPAHGRAPGDVNDIARRRSCRARPDLGPECEVHVRLRGGIERGFLEAELHGSRGRRLRSGDELLEFRPGCSGHWREEIGARSVVMRSGRMRSGGGRTFGGVRTM